MENFSGQQCMEIVKHWHDEIEKLEEHIANLNKIEPGMDETYQQELKEMKLIRTLLPKIKAYVDWQNALSLKDLQGSQFAPIIEEIKKKQRLIAS